MHAHCESHIVGGGTHWPCVQVTYPQRLPSVSRNTGRPKPLLLPRHPPNAGHAYVNYDMEAAAGTLVFEVSRPWTHGLSLLYRTHVCAVDTIAIGGSTGSGTFGDRKSHAGESSADHPGKNGLQHKDSAIANIRFQPLLLTADQRLKQFCFAARPSSNIKQQLNSLSSR